MKTLISIILVLAILIFVMPYVASTEWGKTQVERYLSRKCNCNLQIGRLSLSWFNRQSAFDITLDKQDFHLTIQEITLDSTLLPLLLKARHPEELLFFGDVDVKEGRVSRGGAKPVGQFSIKTTENNKVVFHIDKFPTEIFGESAFPLKEAIGSSFNSDATITFTDKLYNDFQFNATFASPHLSFISSGNYIGGAITFNAPMKTNFLLTEGLGNKIFTRSPVRPTSIKPIELIIFPEGLRIPVEKFSWDRVAIPNMTLKLNQMLFKNFGTVATLLSIIQFNLRPNQDVNFWFQEAPLQLKNGVLSFQRTEMLVDHKYQLGSWGSIDLNRKTLNTYVGITASALRSAFNITFVPDTYTIPVKVDGPISEPRVHKADAAAIISGLILLQTQARSLPFTQIPVTSPSPPARPPFPWQ